VKKPKFAMQIKLDPPLTWARKMTNKKPGKYNEMVGGPQTKKQQKKMKQHGYLTESTNPG